MAKSRSGRNEDLARVARVSYTRAGRSAVAVALAATMAGIAVPVQALAEVAQAQDPAATAPATTAQATTAQGEKDAAKSAAKVAAAEQAPAFDDAQAAGDANVVTLLLDGKEQGGFSVSQVASSWTHTEPKKGADGKWTVDLTFVPKAENKIAGHYSDSGYELDAAGSKLTLTYTYNKWSGWHAFDKADRGTLAFKKAEQAPAFDVSKQKADVMVYDAGEFDPAYEGEVALDAAKATVGKVYKKDGKWAVDVTLKQGAPADWGVADKTSKGVYLADDWNSVTEVTYVTKDLKSSDWKPEGDGPKVAFYQVEQPTTDDVVNAKVTVKTTDGSRQEDYCLDANTYEIGPVVSGYANPMCVVTLRADGQQAYVDEFNAKKDADGTYELAAKPSQIQFYFSYDPETREWSNTTTDQYIYVKKAEASQPDEPVQPTEPTQPTNPTNPNKPSNSGQTAGNTADSSVQPARQSSARNTKAASGAKAAQPAKQAKASASNSAAKASVPKTGDTNSLAGMATAGVLGVASMLAAAVARVLDLRRNAR